MIDVLSFGGGVGSWGYAALVVQGKIRAPWLAAIVDTGRECPSTWEYIERHKAQLPFELHIIKQPLPALWSGNGGSFLPGGYDLEGGSFLRGFCSTHWKRDVFRRWMVRVARITRYNLTFGIHADEWQRMRASPLKSVAYRYPLVDLGITRAECAAAALEVFGELPPRSRCYMCPGQNTEDWAQVKREFPALFAKALKVDAEARRVNLTIFGAAEETCGGECYT